MPIGITNPSRRPCLALLSLILLVPLALAACGSGSGGPSASATATEPTTPLIATDALGRPITIPASAPQRIISLEPSNSEILGALTVSARVIGVDNYTDYPADMAAKPKVTDNYGSANVEQIVALKPDLVLDYGEFHPDADHQLAAASLDVVALPTPATLDQTLLEIRLVGQLVHAYDAATALTTSLQHRIDAVKSKVATAPKVNTYLESDYSTPGKPYVFGGGSFGDELIRDAGGTNVFGSNTEGGGYPQVSDEAVIAANPQAIVLTEDPSYGGNPQAVYSRPGWSAIAAVQNHRVFAIDGALVGRTGPRLVDGLEALAKDLHPELFS